MGEGKMGMEMANSTTSMNISAAMASSFIFNADKSAANYYQGKPDLYDMNRDITGTVDGAAFAIFAPAARRIAAKANNYYNHSYNNSL
ncbi:MAG: hypothetical protein JST89_22220 [Cyanobacteria bacterium SZAS-4]|nr:hypothetical protein [Cyanobacteria bacterium SZAS-4]